MMGVVLLLGLGAPVWARGVDVKVHGWSADGTRFVYEPPADDIGEANDMGGSDGSAAYAVVLDARSGREVQKFLVDVSGEPLPKEKLELAKLPGKAAWRAFLKQQTFACALGGRRSSDGAATLDVQVKGKHMSGRWGKKEFSFDFDPGDDQEAVMMDKSVQLTLLVARNGKSFVSESWAGTSTMGAAGGGLSGSVRACFSPDGRRVAWIVKRDPSMLRDEGSATVLLGAAVTPRVQLVADKTILAAAAAKVGALIDAAGFTSASSKASNEATPRAATVVYAAKGFEADAQKLAALIPGGATVAALDWKVAADVVVGIGASAMK